MATSSITKNFVISDQKQAIDFAKKHQAVTVLKAEPFSNTAKRKLSRFSEIDLKYYKVSYIILP